MRPEHPSHDGALREAKAYGRTMYERLVIAEADRAVLEDRLHEALAANDALRAELGRPAGGRCVICEGLTNGERTCRPCRKHVEPSLRVVAAGSPT